MSDRTTSEGDEVAATVVVGGGIGGLVAALVAAEGRARVVLVEPHPLGGRARCDERDGYVLNRGPRALYRGGPAEQGLQALGVATDAGGAPAMAGAMALHRGGLERFPSGAIGAARTRLLTTAEKVTVSRALAAIVRPGASTDDGQSVAGWLDDRGLHGTPRAFLEAMVRVGTYANAPEALAAGPALANVRSATLRGVRYLDGGWQTLVDQLVDLAVRAGIEIRRGSARSIASSNEGVSVETDDGPIRCRSVVVAAGGPDVVDRLLGARPASWPELGPPATVACLELGVRRPPSHRFLLGIDEPVYASTHAPPARLAPDGHAVVHLMRYQPPGDHLAAADQHATLRRVAQLIGVTDDDLVTERFLAQMTVCHALPTTGAGSLGRPPVAVLEHPGVLVVGDWVGPTGLLLDAVVASAREAGRQAAARWGTMVPA